MPPLPRAVCPWCHSDWALRRNGTFREHRVGPSRKPCEGSGRRPEEHPLGPVGRRLEGRP